MILCPRLIAVLTLAWFAIVASVADAQVLHRFASYVEWPPEALGEGPFVIGVFGADAVAAHLRELLPNLEVQARRAEVRRVMRASDLDGVQILYIGPGMSTGSREVRAAAIERPILLVTDGDDDFAGGGVINFLESDNRVRFEVSLTAADRARLRIDSALLPVAARVEREPQARLRSAAYLRTQFRQTVSLRRRASVAARRAH
jgi:hypothetical protein